MSAPRVCPIDIGQSMVEELTAGLEARAEVDDSRDRCADSTTVGCSPDMLQPVWTIRRGKWLSISTRGQRSDWKCSTDSVTLLASVGAI